jgi:DNA invertase Pin-like site-specific DNA recombinase
MQAEVPIRCAIYTRKSSDEGLDQSFNSLDAQHEACAAYVMSQRHERWTLNPERYDDGGFSGGSMERPGLKQLLADVEAGKIDVIVVYKVDRLTRSLADFAKMVEVLDAAGASFVSITQAFNTTTSMGRLTLNVLLSFAQFEREVTGERIRDKIAASKAKGMWMGGTVPFGYDVADRRLVMNEAEAHTVRYIYRRYLELRSTDALRVELAMRGIVTKGRKLKSGTTSGGVPFGTGGLLHLLKSRLYIGDVVHKGRYHRGEHEPIITNELWDDVQSALAASRATQRRGTRAQHPSLLASLLYDDHQRPMYPSHANKDGKRYRYYITNPKHAGRDRPPQLRLPAHDLEALVSSQLAAFLADPSSVMTAAASAHLDANQLDALIAESATHAAGLAGASRNARPTILQLVERIDLSESSVTITIKLAEGVSHELTAGIAKVRRGSDVRLVVRGPGCDTNDRDEQLVTLLADAHAAQALMLTQPDASLEQLANQAGIGLARFKRLLRLSFLAPDIVEAIVDGRQPTTLTMPYLNTVTNIPHAWDDQRAALGLN